MPYQEENSLDRPPCLLLRSMSCSACSFFINEKKSSLYKYQLLARLLLFRPLPYAHSFYTHNTTSIEKLLYRLRAARLPTAPRECLLGIYSTWRTVGDSEKQETAVEAMLQSRDELSRYSLLR